MNVMACGSLVGSGLRDNLPFRPGAGPNGGNFFLPWGRLREEFARRGVELNTADRNAKRSVDFELHLNAQRRVPHERSYVYLYEDPLVRPRNGHPDSLRRYTRLFTWREDLIDGDRFIELEYPNDLTVEPVPGWEQRELFCVLIASNKALRHPDPRNLHERRVQVIRYFEQQAPHRFKLFGPGWNIPAVRPGALGRLRKRWHEATWRPWKGAAFPSWQGIVPSKREVLLNARFCVCFENCRGSPGYLTEKIFDCFTSGCVPIYAGATHREPPFPADCWIDVDRFPDIGALHAFLEAMTPEAFNHYQRAAHDFLSSPKARLYSNEHFCSVIVDRICADLRLPNGPQLKSEEPQPDRRAP